MRRDRLPSMPRPTHGTYFTPLTTKGGGGKRGKEEEGRGGGGGETYMSGMSSGMEGLRPLFISSSSCASKRYICLNSSKGICWVYNSHKIMPLLKVNESGRGEGRMPRGEGKGVEKGKGERERMVRESGQYQNYRHPLSPCTVWISSPRAPTS